VQLQKSAGSILASNKLARSAPKRVTVRVNGGLGGAASGVERPQGPRRSKRCLVVGLHPLFSKRLGEGPAKTQDDVRALSSGRHTRQKRWGGRGTGAVMATGFYEGSLTVEGTSGCHEPSPFTRRWSRQPWRLPHAGATKETRRRSGSRGRGNGDRGVRGSIGSRHRGKTTPTLGTPGSELPARGFEARQCVTSCDPPKRPRVS